jgi:hypothetical protein
VGDTEVCELAVVPLVQLARQGEDGGDDPLHRLVAASGDVGGDGVLILLLDAGLPPETLCHAAIFAC